MSATTTTSPGPLSKEESEELARFRQEWLEELRGRRAQTQPSSTPIVGAGITPATSGTSRLPGEDLRIGKPPASTKRLPTDAGKSHNRTPSAGGTILTTHPALNKDGVAPSPHVSSALKSALNIYRKAVELEQKSQLDDALSLYRQAFRLDDHVDRAYYREQKLKAIIDARDSVSKEVEDLSSSIDSILTIKPTTVAKLSHGGTVVGMLAEVIKGFPPDIKFEPEDEKLPVLLNGIPEEMFVLICKKLDPSSIERLAITCRKARMLTLDPSLWRYIVLATYRPPQLPDQEELVPVVERYLYDFRRLYIEHPRIRLDGVYISICHYVRAGLSENSWVNITHFITYHRYLRFLPDGQVLSLLANEEQAPHQIIPLLKPTLRMKGLLLGTWKLIGEVVHLSNLIDASGRFAVPDPASIIVGLSDPPLAVPTVHGHGHSGSFAAASSATNLKSRYVFDMTLSLRSRPMGKWNRLDIQTYDSVHLETGDTHPVALKHERPFWFSKVKSYG